MAGLPAAAEPVERVPPLGVYRPCIGSTLQQHLQHIVCSGTRRCHERREPVFKALVYLAAHGKQLLHPFAFVVADGCKVFLFK